jgi:hypothetical protein
MPTRPSDNSTLARALLVLSDDARGARLIVILRHPLSLHRLTDPTQSASSASVPWAVIWSALTTSIHFYRPSSYLPNQISNLISRYRSPSSGNKVGFALCDVNQAAVDTIIKRQNAEHPDVPLISCSSKHGQYEDLAYMLVSPLIPDSAL